MKFTALTGSVLGENQQPSPQVGHNQIKKPTPCWSRLFRKGAWRCPTFARVIRTIIGAESFHGPVRDGKGWVQLAMAAKHKLKTKQNWKK